MDRTSQQQEPLDGRWPPRHPWKSAVPESFQYIAILETLDLQSYRPVITIQQRCYRNKIHTCTSIFIYTYPGRFCADRQYKAFVYLLRSKRNQLHSHYSLRNWRNFRDFIPEILWHLCDKCGNSNSPENIRYYKDLLGTHHKVYQFWSS